MGRRGPKRGRSRGLSVGNARTSDHGTQVLPAEDTLRPPEYVRPGAKSAWPSRPPSAPWALPTDHVSQ